MTALPDGWSRRPLGDALEHLIDHRGQTPGKLGGKFQDQGVPVISAIHIKGGRVDFSRRERFVSQEMFERWMPERLRSGDVLLTSEAPMGSVALVPSDAPLVLSQRLFALRGRASLLDNRYLRWALEAQPIRDQLDRRSSGSTVTGIRQSELIHVELPLPSLSEQRRIVDILEDHLSRLDAATALTMSAVRRLDILEMSGLWRATHGLPGSQAFTLSDVAEVRLGRQRSPKNHTGKRMRPYLRAANVGWDELRLDDVKQMQFTELESATYELHDGDILLTEASGSASEVGKSAIYRREVTEACFQNTLLRVRCHHGVNPNFVQLYLLAEARLGKFVPEARGVGIIHLGRARLASWPILLPSGDGQEASVNIARELAGATVRARECTRSAMIRAQGLRHALLTAAFSGRLTGRAVDMEIVEEMASV